MSSLRTVLGAQEVSALTKEKTHAVIHSCSAFLQVSDQEKQTKNTSGKATSQLLAGKDVS